MAIAPFGLRMPSDVKEWLSEKANQNMRSLNAEIVVALKEKMEKEKAGSPLTA